MRRHSFFRQGDIIKWLEAYRQAKDDVRIYKYHLGQEEKILKRDAFKDADRIVREYWILRCSVDETERDLLERFVKNGLVNDQIAIIGNKNIVENWELIVLSSGDHAFAVFDPVAFGNRLKEVRERRCMYRAEAARYLEMSESTLRSYEDGKRVMRIDTFLKILDLYDVTFAEFFDNY